jgi:hypothetical protein
MLSKEIRVPIFEWLSGNLNLEETEMLMAPYYPSLLKNEDDAGLIGCFELCLVHIEKGIWTEEEAKKETQELLDSLLDER